MGIKLIKCRGTLPANGAVPARNYYFLAPKGLYTGAIATACGIAEDAASTEPLTAVKELLLAGSLERIYVKATKGTKSYKFAMLCTSAKQVSVAADLKTKAVATEGTVSSGAIIQRVINPRRAVNY